jgi:hypothetical protein
MTECDNCQSELDPVTDKNRNGWWRDVCIGCMAEASGAVERGSRTPITETQDYREWLEANQ